MFTLKAYLPVVESFGFEKELHSHTTGQAFSQSIFNHWEQMDGDPLEQGSKVGEIVKSIRTRKGLRVRSVQGTKPVYALS